VLTLRLAKVSKVSLRQESKLTIGRLVLRVSWANTLALRVTSSRGDLPPEATPSCLFAESALADSAGSLCLLIPTAPFFRAGCKGWVVRKAMVEPIVRHLTDFRPLPNARMTDVSTRGRTQRELSHRPTKKKRKPTKRPAPRVCALSVAPTAVRHRFTPAARARGTKAPPRCPTAAVDAPFKTKRE
jgi:hypothetical protein